MSFHCDPEKVVVSGRFAKLLCFGRFRSKTRTASRNLELVVRWNLGCKLELGLQAGIRVVAKASLIAAKQSRPPENQRFCGPNGK